MNLNSKYFRDKQISKLNRIENEIVRRAKKVNFLDSKFDLSTDKLYSMSEEEIRVKFESWRRRLKQGNLSHSQVDLYYSFNEEINKLKKSMKGYVKENVSNREKSFIKALEDNGESTRKYKILLNKLSDKEKQEFFTSDSFMFPLDWYYSSAQFNEFEDITNSSLIYAKLEDWIMNHTHHLDDKKYSKFDMYEDYSKIEKDKRDRRNQKTIEYAKKHGSIYTPKQLDKIKKE